MALPVATGEEVARLLAEASSFLGLGLVDKAREHLEQSLRRDPSLRALREPLMKLYVSQGQYKKAIAELWALLTPTEDLQEEVRLLRYILRLGEKEPAAAERLKHVLARQRGELPSIDEGDSSRLSVSGVVEDLRAYLARHWPSSDLSQTLDMHEVDTHRFPLVEALGPAPDIHAEQTLPPWANTAPAQDPSKAALAQQTIEVTPVDISEERELPSVPRHTPSHVPPPPPPSSIKFNRGGPFSEAENALHSGALLRNSGKHEQAIAMFEKARQDPTCGALATLMAGLCYRELNRPDDAITAFMFGVNRPETSDADLSRLFYELGSTYEKLGETAEAILYYQLSLGTGGSFHDAGERIAALQAKRQAK